MPGEVRLAGYLLVAEEALVAVVEVHGVQVLRQRRPTREVGVARVAPVVLHHPADLPGKCNFPGNVNSREMRLPGDGANQYRSQSSTLFCLCIVKPDSAVLCSRSCQNEEPNLDSWSCWVN